jgi:PAS domain S-box-containing protein
MHEENGSRNKLNSILVSHSQNEVFYEGNLEACSFILTKQVSEGLEADMTSIWIYNKEKDHLSLQRLYKKEEDSFENGAILKRKDFEPYFNAIWNEDIIVADDAETHPATSCFLEKYLVPTGIKSMLDVPIWYRGTLIGVICIESLTPRKWTGTEIDFAQILASFYSFTHSVNEVNNKQKELKELWEFVNESCMISKTDAKGRITYINDKFEQISGYSREELLGKDHRVMNSGFHSKEFWKDMYSKTKKQKKIWHDVCVNLTKDANVYYVDSYIKADFDELQEVVGYISLRQDVSELKKKEIEIANRMDAINRSNMVIEFDMQGNVVYANDIFLEKMGFNCIRNGGLEEIVGKHHKIFATPEFSRSEEYINFWNRLVEGNYVVSEIERVKKDGSKIYLQASYNPISGIDGKVYRIMKIATDITEKIEQRKEIERKNNYLEHAAKIIRHDMHSGINTYIPRGITSLERRLTKEQITDLKIEAPLKMIKEGLNHTQKVYKGVYEFTNLVKKDAVLNRSDVDLKNILESYLSSTAYRSNVIIDDLGHCEVNEPLFCTAIDNLIRNGLRYNDNVNKFVKIYRDENFLYVEDNGRGLSSEEFKYLSQPYMRKEGQKESGTGLGLNICTAILEEHGFSLSCDKLQQGGTQLKINIQNEN